MNIHSAGKRILQGVIRTTIPFPRDKSRGMGSKQRERPEYRRSPSLHQASTPERQSVYQATMQQSRGAQTKLGQKDRRPASVGMYYVGTWHALRTSLQRQAREGSENATGASCHQWPGQFLPGPRAPSPIPHPLLSLLFSRMTTWDTTLFPFNSLRYGRPCSFTQDDKSPCSS